MAFSLFGKKKKKDERFLNLKIREVVPVSKDAVNLIFEQPDQAFNYDPGQFLTIIDTVGGEKVRRAYSLCTTPELDENPGVTVKRVEGGLMSNHINDRYSSGMEVEVMIPMGNFTTQYKDENRHLVLFGGGSGITPLFSILRTVLSRTPKATVHLIYGNTAIDQIIFKEELEKLEEAHENFHLIHILESNEDGYAQHTGRPDQKMLNHILDESDCGPGTEYLICGPDGMMQMVQETLKDRKISTDQIKVESFSNSANKTDELIGSTDTGTSSITIGLDGDTHQLQVSKSKPVLEQALKASLDMPYSCQSGLCTACRAKCLSGEISVDKAEGLTQQELEDGYVLLCVGHAKSDTIEVEVG